MGYHVDVSEHALLDAEEYVRLIRDVNRQPEGAERWFRGLIEAVFSLEESPARCAVVPEAAYFNEPIRHLIYHSHRIIFAIDEPNKRVTIYRIYHGKRKSISPEDLDG